MLDVERQAGGAVDVTEIPADDEIVIAREGQQKARYEVHTGSPGIHMPLSRPLSRPI